MPDATPDTTGLQRTSRDPDRLRDRLQAWLAGQLPHGSGASVTAFEATSANGMSSDTILFDATWTEAGHPHDERLVARIAPDTTDIPVFPSYDLDRQFRLLDLVATLTDVPVPRVWWSEPDEQRIGAPFFVMGRVDGVVPPDVMPYTFGDNWLYDAGPQDQRLLQDETVAVLAELHGIDRPEDRFDFLEFDDPGDSTLRRHVAHTRAWYDFVAADGPPSPLVERGFAWLDEHWPEDEGPTVLSWGDARIGNVMYRDFRPVAVLDWEMAGLGPRELDVAWLVYGHRVFEDIATALGLPGMPDFLRPDDVSARYEALTGHTLRNLDFFLTYAAVQWGIVGLRTGRRRAHFGEMDLPADGDDLLLNRTSLEPMLAR
jgi:aminoglycoside phosphotransferase (APT) family kinase protein